MEKRFLRVMTFNIRHARGLNDKVNLSLIAEEIKKSGAQIVALQEVDRFNVRSHWRDQVRWLAKKLKMNSCFSISLRLGLAQYGNAILSVFPIARKKVVTMPGKMENRTVLAAEIHAESAAFHVINTHLAVSGSDRRTQFPMLMDALDELKGPAILMGDFNMEIDNRIFLQMQPGWERIKPWKKTATVLGGREIDHIFVNRPAETLNSWVQQTSASDHHAVLADIPWHMLK